MLDPEAASLLTKHYETLNPAELKRRIEKASRFVPLERLAVSPQCGFASTEIGNPIGPEMQEAKLRLVVELAQETWGTA